MGKGSFLGEFEQVVLLAVAHLDGEGYGLSIRREIERRTSRSVTVGSVYATLGRLEEKGLTSSYEGSATPRRGGRAKRHFRLEEAGIHALQASRGMLDRMWEGLDFDAASRT